MFSSEKKDKSKIIPSLITVVCLLLFLFITFFVDVVEVSGNMAVIILTILTIYGNVMNLRNHSYFCRFLQYFTGFSAIMMMTEIVDGFYFFISLVLLFNLIGAWICWDDRLKERNTLFSRRLLSVLPAVMLITMALVLIVGYEASMYYVRKLYIPGLHVYKYSAKEMMIVQCKWYIAFFIFSIIITYSGYYHEHFYEKYFAKWSDKRQKKYRNKFEAWVKKQNAKEKAREAVESAARAAREKERTEKQRQAEAWAEINALSYYKQPYQCPSCNGYDCMKLVSTIKNQEFESATIIGHYGQVNMKERATHTWICTKCKFQMQTQSR